MCNPVMNNPSHVAHLCMSFRVVCTQTVEETTKVDTSGMVRGHPLLCGFVFFFKAILHATNSLN